ncbi:hypothetical protein TNCV_1791051 [Trichonephila clavipes]|nr:hypothetical protein TNCV_1791051 [Trichonephila clavipes]
MFMVLETWFRRGGRDFGRGGPMGVHETSAVEVIFDWSTEEEINTLQAPVEDPSNVDMNDDVQEKSDESQLADDASGQTSRLKRTSNLKNAPHQ